MKTFKEFVTEMFTMYPVVDIQTTGSDINIPEIKNELNKNIDIIFRQSFISVDAALEKLAKILAMYSLDIPRVDSNDKKFGSMVLPIGDKNIKYDEFDGQIEKTSPFNLKFSYKLIDGLYKCSAEIH